MSYVGSYNQFLNKKSYLIQKIDARTYLQVLENKIEIFQIMGTRMHDNLITSKLIDSHSIPSISQTTIRNLNNQNSPPRPDLPTSNLTQSPISPIQAKIFSIDSQKNGIRGIGEVGIYPKIYQLIIFQLTKISYFSVQYAGPFSKKFKISLLQSFLTTNHLTNTSRIQNYELINHTTLLLCIQQEGSPTLEILELDFRVKVFKLIKRLNISRDSEKNRLLNFQYNKNFDSFFWSSDLRMYPQYFYKRSNGEYSINSVSFNSSNGGDQVFFKILKNEKFMVLVESFNLKSGENEENGGYDLQDKEWFENSKNEKFEVKVKFGIFYSVMKGDDKTLNFEEKKRLKTIILHEKISEIFWEKMNSSPSHTMTHMNDINLGNMDQQIEEGLLSEYMLILMSSTQKNRRLIFFNVRVERDKIKGIDFKVDKLGEQVLPISGDNDVYFNFEFWKSKKKSHFEDPHSHQNHNKLRDNSPNEYYCDLFVMDHTNKSKIHQLQYVLSKEGRVVIQKEAEMNYTGCLPSTGLNQTFINRNITPQKPETPVKKPYQTKSDQRKILQKRNKMKGRNAYINTINSIRRGGDSDESSSEQGSSESDEDSVDNSEFNKRYLYTKKEGNSGITSKYLDSTYKSSQSTRDKEVSIQKEKKVISKFENSKFQAPYHTNTTTGSNIRTSGNGSNNRRQYQNNEKYQKEKNKYYERHYQASHRNNRQIGKLKNVNGEQSSSNKKENSGKNILSLLDELDNY